MKRSVCVHCADELADTQPRWILLCRHAACTRSSGGPWAWIYEPVRAPRRLARCWSGGGRFIPSRPPLYLPWFLVCFVIVEVAALALLFRSSSFCSGLRLTGCLSCANGFVLSDTCESTRLWAFVSSAVFFPRRHLRHLCVARGFTVCSGFKRGLAPVIWCSLLAASPLIIYPHKKTTTTGFYLNSPRLCIQGEQLCVSSG